MTAIHESELYAHLWTDDHDDVIYVGPRIETANTVGGVL